MTLVFEDLSTWWLQLVWAYDRLGAQQCPDLLSVFLSFLSSVSFLEVTHFFSFLQSFFLIYFFSFQCFHSLWPEKAEKQQRGLSVSLLSHNALSVSILFPLSEFDTYAFVTRFKIFFFFSRKHKNDNACMSYDWTLSMIYGHFLFSFEWLCCYGLDWDMCLIFPFQWKRWKIIILIFFFCWIACVYQTGIEINKNNCANMQNSIESINPVFMDADLIDWLGHAHFFCLQSLKTLPPTSHLSGNHHPVQFSFLPSYLLVLLTRCIILSL